MRFSQEPRQALGFGTEQGKAVFGIRQNDVEVRERGKEKQAAQVSNIVRATPGRFQGFNLTRGRGQGGFISLQAPPGYDDHQSKKEPRSGSPEMAESPRDGAQ